VCQKNKFIFFRVFVLNDSGKRGAEFGNRPESEAKDPTWIGIWGISGQGLYSKADYRTIFERGRV
jgi:hypothetical protein